MAGRNHSKMNMVVLCAIAYVSSAVHEQSEAALEYLLLDARQFNREVGVTGVLLHDEGNFFQYFEGSVDGVRKVYDRILKATRHRGLFAERSAGGTFPTGSWVLPGPLNLRF